MNKIENETVNDTEEKDYKLYIDERKLLTILRL